MRVLLFGGTSEGRLLAAFLSENAVDTLVSVATAYGKELLIEDEHISVRTGRLDEEGMRELIPSFDLVVDATHPYAVLASENIKAASLKEGVRYLRLIRESGVSPETGEDSFEAVFDSVGEAAEFLKRTEGQIFVSTGAKELHKYCVIPDYEKRLVVRVLPVVESREICRKLKLSRVIYAKGPFSYEENLKAFRENHISWLVTKDGGRAGGFKEKLDAAEALGIRTVLIRRQSEEGYTLREIGEKIIEAMPVFL